MALGGRDRGDFLMIMNRPNRYIGRDSVDRGEISFENLRKYYMEKGLDGRSDRPAGSGSESDQANDSVCGNSVYQKKCWL